MQQINKPLEDLSRKLRTFAEIYATGCSAAAAARQAGYSAGVASTKAYRWVRESREQSIYPALFDYYEQIRKERLRLFEVNADSIMNELKIIAFSQIDNYLDIPQREIKQKLDKLREKDLQIAAQLDECQTVIAQFEKEFGKKAKARFEVPAEKAERYEQALAEATKLRKSQVKLREEIRETEDGPGAFLRLKYKEDIPKELMPAVAEIRQTKEGIAVKLHSKMDALDKLARISKMYKEDEPGEGVGMFEKVEVTIRGSRSTMEMPEE